jgi:hypothetical protein
MAIELVVNEKVTQILIVSFFDHLDRLVVPSAATYRVDDSCGPSIVPVTPLSPLGTQIEIEITSAQNRILEPRHAFEERIVTVECDYGVGRHDTEEYRYRVKNLFGVS